MIEPKLYTNFKHNIKDELFLFPYSCHGVKHAKRVLWLAAVIAENYNLTESERNALGYACCFHDIGRINDYTDLSHGRLSAEKALQLNLLNDTISKRDIDTILMLITYHSVDDQWFVGNERECLLYKILKDADALDRVRFGDDLDINYIRLDVSKTMIDAAKELFEKL